MIITFRSNNSDLGGLPQHCIRNEKTWSKEYCCSWGWYVSENSENCSTPIVIHVVFHAESLLPGHWKPFILKHVIADHQRQIDVLNEEKDCIDWVAIMPPSLWRSNYINPYYKVSNKIFRSFHTLFICWGLNVW